MQHRLAAGCLVLHEDRLLLVRYRHVERGDFWVAPGGGVQGDESSADAAVREVREVREETGLVVRPGKLVYVEELLAPTVRHCKFWFVASPVGGLLSADTDSARAEGVLEAAWFTRAEIANLPAFPPVLAERFWLDAAAGFTRGAMHLGLRRMTFF